MEDKIIESVVNKFKQRSETGMAKYGTTLNRTDLSEVEWLNHLQEELMDATAYIEKLKSYAEDSNRFVTIESWQNADVITHEGFLYIRCADLIFGK